MANVFGYYDGLTVKNGRLINEQIEPGMTGIQKASLYRQQMKKQYKIDQIGPMVSKEPRCEWMVIKTFTNFKSSQFVLF